MKSTYFLIIVLAAVVVGGVVYVLRPWELYDLGSSRSAASPTQTPVDDTKPWPPQPERNVPPGVEPLSEVVRVTLKTSKGNILLALDGTRAPLTVGNFVKLANEDFFDGTSFHRVIPDFMIQGGDPLSRDQAQRDTHGTGGPGYSFVDEINAESYGLHEVKLSEAMDPQQLAQIKPEFRDISVKEFYEAQGYRYMTDVESFPLQRGIVAMANSGPNTNGSQFFIITAPSVPHLNAKHTPFGVVEEGMDVVDAISQVETDEQDNPVDPIIIEDVEVRRDPAKAGLQTIE